MRRTIRCVPILLILLLALLSSSARASDPRVSIPVGNSPQKGSAEAPVTIIEFIDFQ